MIKNSVLIIAIILLGILMSGCDKTAESTSRSPIIQSFNSTAGGSTADPNKVIQVTVLFTDPDISGTPNPAEFTFKWIAKAIEPENPDSDPSDNFLIDNKVTCYWRTPDTLGFYQLIVEICDRYENSVIGTYTLEVSHNKSPVVTNIEISDPLPHQNEGVTITVTADDPDGNLPLTYEWRATGGYFTQETDNTATWVGAEIKTFTITVKIIDSLGAYLEKSVTIAVQGNSNPIIDGYNIENTRPVKGESVQISVGAHDPDGDSLRYFWEATGGSFPTIDGAEATWAAPETAGNYSITIRVMDMGTGQAFITIPVEVIEP